MRAGGKVAKLAILVLAMLVMTGCADASADEHVMDVRAWTLFAPDHPPRAIELPARFDGDLPHEDAEFVLRSHVEVPKDLRGERLSFAFSYLHARGTLLVDGEAMAPLVPDMTAGFRGVDQPLWRIPASATEDGTIDLELRVEYHHVMSAWLDVAPRLSDAERGDARFRAIAWINHAQAVTCLVTVSIMSLLYGIVFLLDRRRTAHGWLALQGTFGGAGYAIAYVDAISQRMFGAHENCFVPVFLCIGVVTSVEFTHAQFGLKRPHKAWWWALGGCVLAAVLVPSPFVGPRIAPPYSCAMTVANVAYQVPVSWKLWRERKSLGALVILLSWLGLALLGLPDLIAWSGLGEIGAGVRGACIGLGLVGLMQAIVLSVDHQQTLSRADALNTELTSQLDAVKAKNREVELLNDELRRQIGARADALAVALARASAPSMSDGLDRSTRALVAGEVVAGRYKVQRAVGEGATGAVYEVERITDGKRFALKLLNEKADATEMARFAREAQIIAQLDHPNVVRIADIDASAAGYFFLVMEFIEGLSVRHHSTRYKDVAWAVDVLAQIADGLAAIHARGIVHRDLKPANVLIEGGPGASATSRPRVKIADFGISSVQQSAETTITAMPSTTIPVVSGPRETSAASEVKAPGSQPPTMIEPAARVPKAPSSSSSVSGPMSSSSKSSKSSGSLPSSRTDSLLTQTGVWMGTPKYMAPELSEGAKNALPSTDVFSFGVMAYEMLVGGVPFAESAAMIHLRGEKVVAAASIARKCPTLDPRVAELLDRCLAEEPEKRPEARELADALAREAGRTVALGRDRASVPTAMK